MAGTVNESTRVVSIHDARKLVEGLPRLNPRKVNAQGAYGKRNLRAVMTDGDVAFKM